MQKSMIGAGNLKNPDWPVVKREMNPILQRCLLFFLPTFFHSLRSISFEQGSPKPSPIYALQFIPYPPAQEEVPLDSYFPDLFLPNMPAILLLIGISNERST